MTSKGVSTERVLTELLRSAACTVLVVLVIIEIVFITGEDFHQNVGMVMRMVLLPVGLIRVLFGSLGLGHPQRRMRDGRFGLSPHSRCSYMATCQSLLKA